MFWNSVIRDVIGKVASNISASEKDEWEFVCMDVWDSDSVCHFAVEEWIDMCTLNLQIIWLDKKYNRSGDLEQYASVISGENCMLPGHVYLDMWDRYCIVVFMWELTTNWIGVNTCCWDALHLGLMLGICLLGSVFLCSTPHHSHYDIHT